MVKEYLTSDFLSTHGGAPSPGPSGPSIDSFWHPPLWGHPHSPEPQTPLYHECGGIKHSRYFKLSEKTIKNIYYVNFLKLKIENPK